MAIITYPLDGIMYGAADAETYLCTRTSGVFYGNEVFAASVTDARTVTIGPGLAWMQNEQYAGKSVCAKESHTVTIETADGALPRVDRIVLRFDKTVNGSYFMVKKGTPASSPVPPAIERDSLVYELGLYTVNVPAGSIIVSESDIVSTMEDTAVCGVMSDSVTSAGMAIPGAAEGSLVVTDAAGNMVASNVKVSKLGTGATYRLDGTTLYITTL